MKPTIYMVTGKGGVGKSTVALALAMNLARQGKKTRLIELGETSFFSYLFKRNLDSGHLKIQENLELSLWSGESCLREFIGHYLRIRKLTELFFENKIMKTFMRAAPALQELAILGKLTSAHRNIGPPMKDEAIVLDGYSSGHFMALLRAPRGMAEAVKFGPMGEQSRTIYETLTNKEFCKIIVVCLPEELPTQETIELATKIKNEFQQDSTIVANSFLRPPKSEAELKVIRGQNPHRDEFIDYLLVKLARQEECRQKLKELPWAAKELPLVTLIDPLERVKEIANKMGDLCTAY